MQSRRGFLGWMSAAIGAGGAYAVMPKAQAAVPQVAPPARPVTGYGACRYGASPWDASHTHTFSFAHAHELHYAGHTHSFSVPCSPHQHSADCRVRARATNPFFYGKGH